MRNKAIACLGAIVACATALAGIPATAMADDSAGLTPQYTYNSQNDNGMTFEKVSHADQGLSQADGVVDYTGDGTIAPYTAGLSTTGNGDRGQSYSYAAASSGDWVYIGTMYGGLGVQAILNRDMTSLGLTSKQATALIQTMYAGNMYLGEPDGKSAGGMLFKFNVKTGKTKILMSKSTGIDGGKGVIPTFRSAFKMNGKLYFEGMVMDTNNKDLTQQEIQTAMAYQNGFPCIYEVDPANNDKLTKVYDSVDVDGFRSLVKGNVFTSTRAIGSFGNTLIAGDLKPTADGKGKALLVASKTPSDPNSYKVIADMASFDNLPAIHRQDVNGGGGIYQVQEFNGKLYVVVCTGDTSTLNEETGTMRSFAIYVGENKGDSTNKADWTWRPLVGDTAKGAKYYYGLDKSRVSAGACTLQVYGDHLYIGDYNDVSSALQGFVTKSNFVTQATNLEQSVNLYRMDKNENVEMLVGDKNDTFPKGGSTGLGSGYDNHMNQYTWQTTVHEGKMYLSTMNTTTLLEPIAQFTNGDILNMNEKDWNNTVHYLRVFLRLLWGMGPTDPASAIATQSNDQNAKVTTQTMPSTDNPEALVDWARIQAGKDASAAQPQTTDAKSVSSAKPISLTAAQTKELVDGIKDGSIVPGSLAASGSSDEASQLFDINNELDEKEIDSWIRLTRVLTHEIMNAVTPITSLSDTLLGLTEAQVSKEEIRNGLQTISSTGKGLLSFVESYRKFTRIPTPEPSLFYVKSFIERMVELARHQHPDVRVTFHTDIAPSDLILYADENLVSQVVINLLKNAIQAIESDKNTDKEGHINIRAYCNEAEAILIEISNNGPAIPNDIAEHIFIPFFTTKEGGSGIGLSISRQIMRLSGGNLSLLPGKETTFILKFN